MEIADPLAERTKAALRKLRELTENHERQFISTQPLGAATPPAIDADAYRRSRDAIREAYDEVQRLFDQFDRQSQVTKGRS